MKKLFAIIFFVGFVSCSGQYYYEVKQRITVDNPNEVIVSTYLWIMEDRWISQWGVDIVWCSWKTVSYLEADTVAKQQKQLAWEKAKELGQTMLDVYKID